MEKILTKIIGLQKTEFDAFAKTAKTAKTAEINLREAKLIPTYKLGDEMALTSVFLSSLRLIKEFRKMIFSVLKLTNSGTMFVYTEIEFSQFPKSRIDGLILIVKGGVIKDAALFEMKNGKNELEKEQIERYIQIAKNFSIPKLITISNQFVSEPTQFPLQVKTTKSVDLYHLSWSYLLTIAYVLLTENETNIADEDQVEIMREVVNYFEHDKSGVCGLNQMKSGWSHIVEKINTGSNIKVNDEDVRETVLSWQQEEKDMALILSRHLGVLVSIEDRKYKGDLRAKLEDTAKSLVNDKELMSILRVKGAVSDIKVLGLFEKRTVEMLVALKPPHKTVRGQLGWLNRQIENCKKKAESLFDKIKDELIIEVQIKNSRNPERIKVENLHKLADVIKDREIKEFRILYLKDFGKKFSSPKKFVDVIEMMLVDFYSTIVQFLVKWEPSAPKISIMPKQSNIDLPVTIEETTADTYKTQDNQTEHELIEQDNIENL